MNNFDLTSEQQLLLQAALSSNSKAVEAWQQWQNTFNFEKIDGQAYYLLPLLYQNLAEHQFQDSRMAKLKGIYRSRWYKNNIRLSQIKSLLNLLSEQGLSAVFLNSIPIASNSLQEHIGILLPIYEFNIFIKSSDVLPAIGILTKNKWKSQTPIPENPIAVSTMLRLQTESMPNLNLTWRLFDRGSNEDSETLFKTSTISAKAGDSCIDVLEPVLQILTICSQLNLEKQSAFLKCLTETLILLKFSDIQIDWSRLSHLAQKYDLVMPLTQILTKARSIVNVNTLIPVDILESLPDVR